MINLLVDEAYAFDFLSILEVKNNKMGVCEEYIIKCCESIKDQIGVVLFEEIIKSKEYKALYEANLNVFETIDLAKQDLVTASEVDTLNFERYINKTKLQKRFFEITTLEEKKN